MNLVTLANKNKQQLHTVEGEHGDEPILVNSTLARAHGVFASATRGSAGTTVIVQPSLNQEIVMTDLMLSAEKQAGSTVTIQWTDGANTVVIFIADTVDAPVTLAIPFAGRWQGWKDARLELVTDTNGNVTVAVGYYKVETGITFAEWNGRR